MIAAHCDLSVIPSLLCGIVRFSVWACQSVVLHSWVFKIIDASEGIELIKSDYTQESEDHDHDHDHVHDEEYNPHVWLSVKNAIKQVENIENKLIEYNSINKDMYIKNTK